MAQPEHLSKFKNLAGFIQLLIMAGFVVKITSATMELGRKNEATGETFWIPATGTTVEEVRAWLEK